MSYDFLVPVMLGCGNVRAYSGRGMYGRRCPAIVVADTYIPGIVADLMLDCPDEHLIAMAELCRHAKIDSMGVESILYFPTVKWQDHWQETSEEDSD
jgi:hypothetical protein